MISFAIYIINYGAGQKYLGNFYIFSMMNGSMTEKYYLLISGICMIVTAISYRELKRN